MLVGESLPAYVANFNSNNISGTRLTLPRVR